MSDREVREELERVQGENKKLKARLKAMEGRDVEELEARVSELEADKARLQKRLDRADLVRLTSARRYEQLERELATARVEQERLRRMLDGAREELTISRRSQGTLSRLLRVGRPAK